MTALVTVAGLLALGLVATTSGTHSQGSPSTPAAPSLAPFVASPPEVVDRMLRLARVGPGDVVYDLGSGDGRVIIAAARTFGARGVGIEIDPRRIAESRENAERAGVADRVTFRLQDALTADVSQATVVTLYLLTASNIKLRPLLTRQLPPTARIVAHGFGMGDWTPDTVETFADPEGVERTLYLWIADGRVRP